MITTIILGLSVLLMIFSFIFMERNRRVRDFRLVLIDYCFSAPLEKYIEGRDRIMEIINRHSYDKMLFSFKPLRLEEWYSEEDIKFLKSLKRHENRR